MTEYDNDERSLVEHDQKLLNMTEHQNFILFFRSSSMHSCSSLSRIRSCSQISVKLIRSSSFGHVNIPLKIFNKLKIFEYHQIQNFSNNIDLRKQVFLSAEKISERFVNKDVI